MSDAALELIRQNDPSVTEFDTYVSIDKVALTLANALGGNTHLRRLNLTCEVYRPNFYLTQIGERNVKALEEAIVGSKLTCLSLAGEGRGFLYSYFGICLLRAARRSPTIQDLAIRSSVDGGFEHVTLCLPHLQQLRYDGAFRRGDIQHLCEGLRSNLTLTRLELINVGSAMREANGFWLLSQALADNSSLTTLHIHGSDIGDDGVKDFLRHWPPHSNIHTLAFTNCNIAAHGAMLLIQAGSAHAALDSLSLQGNRRIGYDGLANIAMEIPNLSLKSLNLASCTFFQDLELFLGDATTFEVLEHLITQGVNANTSLEKFDISGNGFDLAAKEKWAFYMLRNKFAPLVTDFQLPISVWCHCFAKHGRNPSFIAHFLSAQPLLWPVERVSHV